MEAALPTTLTPTWLTILDRVARSRSFKYADVQGFILEGAGPEARDVCEGLLKIPIVIVDACELLRRHDIDLLSEGLPPLFTNALSSSSSGCELDTALGHVRRMVCCSLLDSSGAGTIAALTERASTYGWISEPCAFSTSALAKKLRPSLRHTLSVSSKSTVLTLHAQREPVAMEAFTECDPGLVRFGVPDRWYAQAILRAIGKSKTIFDAGEKPDTEMVDELRRQAARAGAIWSDEPENDEATDAGGFVREGDDLTDWRLRVADIAAGYARDLLHRCGLAGMRVRYEVLLYNGAPLAEYDAERLDRERRQFEALAAKH